MNLDGVEGKNKKIFSSDQRIVGKVHIYGNVLDVKIVVDGAIKRGERGKIVGAIDTIQLLARKKSVIYVMLDDKRVVSLRIAGGVSYGPVADMVIEGCNFHDVSGAEFDDNPTPVAENPALVPAISTGPANIVSRSGLALVVAIVALVLLSVQSVWLSDRIVEMSGRLDEVRRDIAVEHWED